MEPGLLYTERQYGLLELHAADLDQLNGAGEAILKGIGRKAEDQLKPRTLYADIIENVADQHAIILNRTREASMLLPGKSLLVYELEPALFASVAANEAEKAAPGITLVDVQMIGASGRLFLAGTRKECERARDRIDEVLGSVLDGRGKLSRLTPSPSPRKRGEGLRRARSELPRLTQWGEGRVRSALPLRPLPGRMNPNRRVTGRQRCLATDHIARLLGDHDRRRIGVAADDPWHDRGIDHPQTVYSMDLELIIDDG